MSDHIGWPAGRIRHVSLPAAALLRLETRRTGTASA